MTHRYLDGTEVQVGSTAGGMSNITFPGGAQLRVSSTLLTATPSHVRHRTNDRPTSVQAAESIQASARSPLGPLQVKVLAALAQAGGRGLIDHDHFNISNISQDTAGKRRGEMMDPLRFDPPLVEDSGLTRKTPRGRDAVVWRITQAGLDVYRSLQQKGAA
jgi:hypothetical protein